MTVQAYELQMIAEQQRVQLHESLSELRGRVRTGLGLKENLRATVKENMRRHATTASAVAGIGAILAGYAAGGWFTPARRKHVVLIRA